MVLPAGAPLAPSDATPEEIMLDDSVNVPRRDGEKMDRPLPFPDEPVRKY